MINVMHVTYDMRIGGTEMVIKSLVEGVDDKKFNMSIFCLESPLGPWGKDLNAMGVEITSYNRKDGFDFTAIKAIRAQIIQNQIDVLHCHQYTPWVYGALAACGLSAKVIFTEHGRFYPDVKSWKRRWVNPFLARLTDHITAISKATSLALKEYEYIDENSVEVIYNGIASNRPTVSMDLREKLNIDKEALLLGTIARFDPIKNHSMMLDSIAELINRGFNVHLILVGDGECRQEITDKIAKLRIADYVTLTGYIKEPFDYLNIMEVFLLTSFSEGTSMTLLEAMRSSKPCIVTNVGGNPEVIQHDHNGFVIESENVSELTQSVIKLYLDENLKNVMGENALKRFTDTFTSENMCNKFSSLYQLLVKRK
jgi:glycosyltransferase involved in cell wall biosynthesis